MGFGLAVCGMSIVYSALTLLAWTWRQARVGQGRWGGASRFPFFKQTSSPPLHKVFILYRTLAMPCTNSISSPNNPAR